MTTSDPSALSPPPPPPPAIHGEMTPLLVSQTSEECTDELGGASDVAAVRSGKATVFQTILNLAKCCMGTGCLALAYACQQSGMVVYVVGMTMIAAWNVYSVERLCRCLEYLPQEEQAIRHPEAAMMMASPVTKRKKQHQSPPLSVSSEEQEETFHVAAAKAEGHQEDVITSSSLETARFVQTSSAAAAAASGGDHFPLQRNSENENGTYSELPPPPTGTSTFGLVAWHAFGDVGLQVMDIVMLILFSGIVVAYFSALIGFLSDTPFSAGAIGDAAVAAIVVACFCLVPDLGYLSRVSAAGLTVLMGTFAVIAAVGVVQQQYQTTTMRYSHTADSLALPASLSLKIWPESLSDLSHFFGIVVFGYGVVPITYNFQESMAQPTKLVPATGVALAFVGVLYMFMGVGLYALFPAVSGEILHELGTGVIPTLARLAMVGVTITTAPLLVVPGGDLLQTKWSSLWNGNNSSNNNHHQNRIVARLILIVFSAITAVLLPGFVQVLSFVGCACVGLISFVFPPLLHLRFMLLAARLSSAGNNNKAAQDEATINSRHIVMPLRAPKTSTAIVDSLLLAWGMFATIVSTLYTIGKL